MIQIEDILIDTISDDAEVDGHDAGSREVNIFVRTGTPEMTFRQIQEILSARGLLTHLRAAFREFGQNEYKILWPLDLKQFAVA